MASKTASASQTESRFSWNAVIAFVLSAIGLLFPFGLWLGYRTRGQIDGGNGESASGQTRSPSSATAYS